MTPVLALLALSVAAAPLDEDTRFVEAVHAYEELELDAALAAFRALLPRYPAPADRARLLVWTGLTHAQQSQLDDASAAFGAALALDRDVALPPARYTAPKVVALFEEARARVPPERDAPAGDGARAGDGGGDGPGRADDPARPVAPDAPARPPLAAFVTGGAGAVALLGAGVAAVLTTVHYSGAVDRTTPQPDAKALVDLANAELAGAIVLGGAALLLGGATLVLLDAPADAAAEGDGP